MWDWIRDLAAEDITGPVVMVLSRGSPSLYLVLLELDLHRGGDVYSRLELLLHSTNKPVENITMNVNSFNSAAALSRVEHRPVDEVLGNFLHIHIRAHIGRVIPAQLKMNWLDVTGGCFAKLDTTSSRTGEGNGFDFGKLDNFSESVDARHKQNLENIRWKTRLGENVVDLFSPDRGLWRWAEDDCVACQKGWDQGVDGREERILSTSQS